MLGLFAVHLSLEKAVKAHVVKQTGKMPPKIHNLIRLAEIAEIELKVEHKQVLAEVNEFNIEGRYTDTLPTPISLTESKYYMRRAKGTLEWLISLL